MNQAYSPLYAVKLNEMFAKIIEIFSAFQCMSRLRVNFEMNELSNKKLGYSNSINVKYANETYPWKAIKCVKICILKL